MKFRTLKAEEIDVRVQQVTEKGAVLLLYKDARCDMNILDETVGMFNWQRDHKELKGNIYAGVGIYQEEQSPDMKVKHGITGRWVWKWDAGAESNTEAVKGESSDSFKRACVNWGIGRELYTSPFIWVPIEHITTYTNPKTGKLGTYDKFKVNTVEYNDNREIKALEILNAKTGKRVYGWRA